MPTRFDDWKRDIEEAERHHGPGHHTEWARLQLVRPRRHETWQRMGLRLWPYLPHLLILGSWAAVLILVALWMAWRAL